MLPYFTDEESKTRRRRSNLSQVTRLVEGRTRIPPVFCTARRGLLCGRSGWGRPAARRQPGSGMPAHTAPSRGCSAGPPSSRSPYSLPLGLPGRWRQRLEEQAGKATTPGPPAHSTCCPRPPRGSASPGGEWGPGVGGCRAGRALRLAEKSQRLRQRPFAGSPGGRDPEAGLPGTPAHPQPHPSSSACRLLLPLGSGSGRRAAEHGRAQPGRRAPSHGRRPLSDPEGPGAGRGEAPESWRDREWL